MRRTAAAILLALALSAALAGSALGKVHGITPLGCMTNDPSNAGANQTEDGAADSENGGPISGIIPTTLGNASFTPGTDVAGRNSAVCD